MERASSGNAHHETRTVGVDGSRHHLASLIRNSTDLVLVVGVDGRVLYACPALRTVLGWDPDGVVGRLGTEFIHPEDTAEFLGVAFDVPGQHRTIRVRHADANYCHIEFTVTDLTNDDAVGGYLINGRDVTEHIHVARELRIKEAAQSLIATISLRFAKDGSKRIDANIFQSLEDIRAFFGADRVGIWRHAEGSSAMSVTHESSAVGVEPVYERVPAFRITDITERSKDLDEGRILIAHDDHDPSGLLGMISVPDAPPMRSIVFVPMRTDDKLLGCMNIVSLDNKISYTNDQLAVLETVTAVLTSSLARYDADRALAHQAMHDTLTGLANRAMLSERMTQALARCERTGNPVGTLFVDLDEFKAINDSLGHEVGDEVLLEVASRLRQTCRATDTIARLGGDEFVVVLEGSVTPSVLSAVATRIQYALAQPYAVTNRQLKLTASIGVAVHNGPDDAQVMDAANGAEETNAAPEDRASAAASLLRKADIAMYRAKERGRNRTEMFTDDMEQRTKQRFELVDELHGVARRDELVLHFQPVIDAVQSRIVSAEALVRWRHPTRGLLGPGAFIDVAEESGLIGEIGAWVVDRATQQLAKWLRAGDVPSDFTVSVNLSPRQLADPGLCEVIANALARHGCDSSRLQLELTESVFTDRHLALTRILELRDLGVLLAIDDFGTGYSSLAYLRDLPIHGLKIDRSFVQGLGVDQRDAALVKAVIQLSGELGLSVVAEGVETEVQLVVLRELGCRLAQGFHFSPAVPTENVPALFSQWFHRSDAK